jgi:purine nucleosidase
MERIPVLLDTDIGSDIDDAVCLAYLLKNPRCELVGITTVTGEPRKRAMLASAICRAAGRDDIPIHAGAPYPLLTPLLQPKAPQAAILERWPHKRSFRSSTAIEFMRSVFRERQGVVTLLAIGPLTNVALLLATDPEMASYIGRLVTMGGVFHLDQNPPALREWNTLNDPYAAAVVYARGPGKHICIGLDVTMRCRMPREEVTRRFQGGPLDVVADAAGVWFRCNDDVTFHDPLAATVIFKPDICRYEEGHVEVELGSERLRGVTHWQRRRRYPCHHAAVDVDPDAFFTEYFSVFG